MQECICHQPPFHYTDFEESDLGYDSRYGEVMIAKCNHCQTRWLVYLLEEAHYSRSGRWWRTPVSHLVSTEVTVQTARALIESAPWCFIGGSFYDGQIRKITRPISVT